MQTVVGGLEPWEPGTVWSMEDGELYVFSFETEESGQRTLPGGRPLCDETEGRLRSLLAEVLGCRETRFRSAVTGTGGCASTGCRSGCASVATTAVSSSRSPAA
ncbi:hypothetical protein Q5762_28025 [Streptomyces sp. P9(2023)]|uniref:hypothetical protein n=1 Tax=Streptomyces sp. P9(2023) TaxID=3064394 RepID=UPI0028F417F5|nr:hypothetical protein [Streptomyces sp. P9(2023)]MDT9692110.1 hypothetical protein [Streptomyces sp. P9(2023)]